MISLTCQVKWLNLNKKVSDKPGTVHFYEKLEALNLSFEDLTEHNLIDAKVHLKKIIEKGKIYRLTDTEKTAKAFYVQVVLVQRAALAYKSEHDEVFEILFQNYPESDMAENYQTNCTLKFVGEPLIQARITKDISIFQRIIVASIKANVTIYTITQLLTCTYTHLSINLYEYKLI